MFESHEGPSTHGACLTTNESLCGGLPMKCLKEVYRGIGIYSYMVQELHIDDSTYTLIDTPGSCEESPQRD